MLLFVGLGNPSPDNENNRHNIGFKIIDAINQKFNLNIKVSDYNQNAISSGADAKAAAFIELEHKNNTVWGAGINPNTTQASFEAIVVGLSKLLN